MIFSCKLGDFCVGYVRPARKRTGWNGSQCENGGKEVMDTKRIMSVAWQIVIEIRSEA